MTGEPRGSEAKPLRVLYVTGTGRSGSTLLTRLLGSVPGVFAAGEMRFLWDRGLAPGARCGCRELVRDCPVWSAVSRQLDPRGDGREAAEFEASLYSVIRMRRAPRWLLRPRRRLTPEETDVARRLVEAYRAVSATSGAALIVDSSKHPNFAALLDSRPELDVSMLHLVRDPRAAAWSWQRGSAGTVAKGFDEPMDRLSWVKSSALWMVWNGLTAFRFGRRSQSGQYLRMRYEDIMENPRRAASEIAAFAGIDPSSLPFTDDIHADLATSHVIAGNPNRMDDGSVTFSLDRRWETAMSTGDKAKVTLLTMPLLGRFGYSRKYS